MKGAWGGSCEQEVKTWDLDLEHYGEVQIWHIFDKKTLSQMNLKKRGVSLEQEVKTWDPDLKHNGEVQIWQTI